LMTSSIAVCGPLAIDKDFRLSDNFSGRECPKWQAAWHTR
jgi:hypothetical protein